jgi:Family of unknown function (DUF6152)
MRRTLTFGLAVLTCATGLLAHHSYGTFYKIDQRVTLKGQVSKVTFSNPHVMLTIETKSSGTWQAEWTNTDSLMRQGVRQDTIQAGDVLEIDASPSRISDARVVSALAEIRRPLDGWRWVRSDYRVIE